MLWIKLLIIFVCLHLHQSKNQAASAEQKAAYEARIAKLTAELEQVTKARDTLQGDKTKVHTIFYIHTCLKQTHARKSATSYLLLFFTLEFFGLMISSICCLYWLCVCEKSNMLLLFSFSAFSYLKGAKWVDTNRGVAAVYPIKWRFVY